MNPESDDPAIGTWARRLLGAGLWIGLAESLSVFFWVHVRGGQVPAWVRELGIDVGLGSLLGAGLFVALGAGLAGLGCLLSRPVSGSWPRLRAALRRVGGLPVVLVAWLTTRLVYSDIPAGLRAVSLVVGSGLLAALIAVGLPRVSSRLRRAWPLLFAPVLVAGVWLAVGGLGRGRLEPFEQGLAALGAGVPVVLLAIAWVVGLGRSPRIRSSLLAGGVLLSGGFLALFAPATPAAADPERPNVLLLTIDTLRTDRVDGPGACMPRLAALADQGASYLRAYTPIAKTQQSVASFMTGLYPWNHGVRELFTPLATRFDTLAERFARAGYATAAFVHNAWLDYGMGHEQGFGQYIDYQRIESLAGPLHALLAVRLLDRSVGRKRGASDFQVDGRVLTDQVVAWLAALPDRPWFVWVHLFDPHWPYLPPVGTPGRDERDVELARDINQVDDRRIDRGRMIFQARRAGLTREQIEAAGRLYSAEAAYTDVHVGRILDALPAGRSNLVAITADHGESLGEHEYHFHHGDFTYDVCLRVPLIVAWPGRIAPNQIVSEPVMTIDLVDTLCRLSGIDPGATDGRALPGLGLPEEPGPGRVVGFEGELKTFPANDRILLEGLAGKWRGLIRDGFKLIAVPGPKSTRFELYDLNADPGELHDLSAEPTAALTNLVQALRADGRLPDAIAAPEPPVAGSRSLKDLSDEERERLRSLGYVE